METFYLKYRDTLPILEAALKNPDHTPFDLTGSTTYKLYIRLERSATVLIRTMTKQGLDAAGLLRYQWLDTDWNPGGLVTGSHQMEYEVIGGSARLTFPNSGFDELRITEDLGQG